jgi:hypothetical protein
MKAIFLSTFGLMILMTVLYQTGKHLFGWTDYGYWPGAIMAGISGAGVDWVGERRTERMKLRQGSVS